MAWAAPLLGASCGLALSLPCAGDTGAIGFTKDIAPILLAKCAACHGPEKAKGGYRIDTFERLMTRGDSEEAPVNAGHPEQSHLFQLIAAADEDDRMPQKDDPLTSEQVGRFHAWIAGGALFDGPDQKAPLFTYAGPSDHPAPPAVYPKPVPALALAFSPDASELAVGGYHEITIWNPLTGTLVRRVTNIAERVQSVAWHTNGEVLAVAGGSPGRGGEARLVHPQSGTLLKLLCRTPDVMLCARFSPDGSRLAVAGADNAIRLFSASDGSEEIAIEQHSDWVMDVSFDADGGRIVTASRDKTARVFDLATGELVESYFGHNEPVFAAVFAADGQRVFSAGRDREIHLWTIKEATKKGEIGGLSGYPLRLLLAGDWLGSCYADGTVRLHKTGGKRELIRALEGHNDSVYGMDAGGGGVYLATSDHAGDVRVWNVQDGSLVNHFVAAPGWRQ